MKCYICSSSNDDGGGDCTECESCGAVACKDHSMTGNGGKTYCGTCIAIHG